MDTQKPSVGRIVHYHLKNGQVRPALVVTVWNEDCVNLHVHFDGTPTTSPRTFRVGSTGRTL